MGNIKIKKMVQGALIAAIFGALSLFNTYTGSLFDIFICYAMVIPIVWYNYHYRIQDGLILSVTSMLVIILTGLPFFVISSFSSCLIGLFIGQALKRHASRAILLTGTLALTFFNNILLYEILAGLLNVDLIAEMKDIYVMIQGFSPSLTKSLTLEAFLSLAPILLLIMSVLEMYVIILFCQITLSRFSIAFPSSFHIACLHLSQRTGIIVAGFFFASYVIQNVYHFDSFYLTYIYLISMLIFAVEGVAFLSWLVILKQKPRWIVFIFIGFLIPMILSIYVVIGIIDIFSDLREKLLYNKRNEQ